MKKTYIIRLINNDTGRVKYYEYSGIIGDQFTTIQNKAKHFIFGDNLKSIHKYLINKYKNKYRINVIVHYREGDKRKFLITKLDNENKKVLDSKVIDILYNANIMSSEAAKLISGLDGNIIINEIFIKGVMIL